MHAFPFILLAGSLLSAAAWGGQNNEQKAGGGAVERLQEVERALDKGLKRSRRLKRQTDALTGEVKRLGLELVATARVIQDHEAEVSGLEDRLARLALDEAEKYAGLERRRGQYTRVMMALERLARIPPEAVVVQPLSPSDTVRSAILLRAAVPEIERRAEWLRHELNGLTHARRQIADRRRELSTAAAALKGQRGRLALMVAKKKVLKQRTRNRSAKAERRVKALAGEAKSLRQLLARLEEERRARAARPVPDEPPPAPPGGPSPRPGENCPFPPPAVWSGAMGRPPKTG
jgi:septal ring factor EnvC (AmiA/AmiB activator)